MLEVARRVPVLTSTDEVICLKTNRVEILCSVLVSNTLLILIRKLSRGAGGRVQSELGLYARTAKRGVDVIARGRKHV